MKTIIKETLIMLICILNISMAMLGFYFMFEDMHIYVIVTVIVFILIQPLSWNTINKLS